MTTVANAGCSCSALFCERRPAIYAATIKEYRYSVTDVIFNDVGNINVPREYQKLYAEYCAEIDILPVSTPMWRSATPEYKNCLLSKARHKAYTKSLLCSGDEKRIKVAEEAMLYQLDRYYESYQQEKLFRESRANLEKKRKEDRRWIAQDAW